MSNFSIKSQQTALRICFNLKRLWIGILLAIISVILCKSGGASLIATTILPAAFLFIAVVEVYCSSRVADILIITWSIIGSFVIVFTSQLLLNESVFSLGLQRIFLNMAICGIVIGFIYLIIARLRLSVIIGMAVLMIFTATNYFVFIFRGSELCPADFLSIGTAVAVADRYTISVNAPFVYAVILAMLFSFSVFCVKSQKQKITKNKKKRTICVAGILILTMVVMFGSNNINALHFLQTGSVSNGYILNFLLQIEENVVKKPNGYDIYEIKGIEEKYIKNVDCNNEELPIIIVIMNESFADLSILGNKLQTNIDVMPFFDSLDNNVIKGFALSSVIGGGTANSEYEFLSGNTMGFLPAGSIVYQQFLDDNPYTIIPYLNKLGYTTIATHPEDEKNWLRFSIYPRMEFDRTYFINDYPCNKLLREFVSDYEMYSQIIKWYEEIPQTSNMFLFGVSMQNHGFYDYSGKDFEKTITLEGYNNSYSDVEQYLTVLHESDIALEYLINYFEKADRDVVILFYGDHFPKLDLPFYEELHGGIFNSLEEQMLQYTVPFFIWTNYDIEEKYIELTSLNYLSNILFKTAGIELPAYNKFLSDMQTVIPAMNSYGYFSKEQDKFIPYSEATGIEADYLRKYSFLQYNCIFDNENTSEIFDLDFKK